MPDRLLLDDVTGDYLLLDDETGDVLLLDDDTADTGGVSAIFKHDQILIGGSLSPGGILTGCSL